MPPTNEQLLAAFPILRYFAYAHLQDEVMRARSQRFSELAYDLAGSSTGAFPEVAAGLRKLLEAKDCFVRAALP